MEYKLNKRKIKGSRIAVEIIMILFSAYMIIPFLWMFSTSLRLPKDSFTLPPSILPTTFNLDSYIEVFNKVPYLNFYWNSLKIALLTALGVVVVSTTAAYAFARLKFPGRDLLFILMLAGIMVPAQVTII
ncbi:MAG TPA: carbohydrate ABC transporter permease, partial [Clostridiaceae bacterium]|nr:carbohydrate ABC transporter permease [Clostridiaceae bacterium]